MTFVIDDVAWLVIEQAYRDNHQLLSPTDYILAETLITKLTKLRYIDTVKDAMVLEALLLPYAKKQPAADPARSALAKCRFDCYEGPNPHRIALLVEQLDMFCKMISHTQEHISKGIERR